MMDNLQLLQETLLDCERLSYSGPDGTQIPMQLSPEQMREITVFLPEQIDALKQAHSGRTASPAAHRCRVDCIRTDTLSAAIQLAADLPEGRRVLALNFANAFNPGGGVRHGSRAQEEDLCRKTSLLRSLESGDAVSYYRSHHLLGSDMASDAMMISPNVEVFRQAGGKPLDRSTVISILTCAAPHLRSELPETFLEDYRSLMLSRISGILYCAAANGYQDLILGAFGCGAFHNDAQQVSDFFREAMEQFTFDGKPLDDVFRNIIFAVISRTDYNFDHFYRNFAAENFHPADNMQK